MSKSRTSLGVRRRALCVAVSAAGLLLATACGSSSGSDSTGSHSTASSSKARSLLPAEIKDAGVLRIGTNAVVAPCESTEPNGDIVGIETDIWNAMAKLLGVKVDVTSIDFDGLIPAVQSGRYDIAMSCISDKPEREAQVSFVDIIYSQAGVVFPDDNPHTISSDPLSVCGLTAGTARGETYAAMVDDLFSVHCEKNGKPKVVNKQFSSNADIYLALRSGRIDFLLENLTAARYEKGLTGATVVQSPLIPKFQNGIVIGKDNVALQNAILAAMQELFDNGTYKEILDKWKVPEIALDAPGINLATKNPLPTPTP